MVAIKDFEMPSSCNKCLCAYVYQDIMTDIHVLCYLLAYDVTDYFDERPKMCPLMEVIDDVKLP